MPLMPSVLVEDLDANDLREAMLRTLDASGFSYGQLEDFADRDDFPSSYAKATWFAVRDLK